MENVTAGIDFGTTNSSIIVLKNGVHRYGDSENETLPSVVAINKENGRVICGKDALSLLEKEDNDFEVFRSIKSVLDDRDKTFEIANKIWTPEDIAEQIFIKLKQTVYERSNREYNVNKAVVAIPVNFSPEKRRILRRAAERAGIEVKSFITESTAAFIANYKSTKGSTITVVFDWGGGTLDVSVIEYNHGTISELATRGKKFAGNDIDEKIARKLHSITEDKYKLHLNFDDLSDAVQNRMLRRCESAKIQLSENECAKTFPIKYGDYGQIQIDGNIISRTWLSNLLEEDINKISECLMESLRIAKQNIYNVDKIILTGGSCKLKTIQDKMVSKYGKDKIIIPQDSSWDVTLGAAILSCVDYDIQIGTKVSLVLHDGSECPILTENTFLPYRKKYCFGILDTTKQARFVFGGDPDINRLEDKYRVLDVKCENFLEEQIILDVYIDEDLMFIAKANSNFYIYNNPENAYTVFEYPHLKFKYRIDLDHVKY